LSTVFFARLRFYPCKKSLKFLWAASHERIKNKRDQAPAGAWLKIHVIFRAIGSAVAQTRCSKFGVPSIVRYVTG
jgi:hypothetical protein